jgi:hypothetical protein
VNRSYSKQVSRRVALGGLFTAVALLLMQSASFLPIATYAAPIFAGLALLPIADEVGTATALAVYLAVSLLSAFSVADVEASAMFIAFFGYYPTVRRYFHRIRLRPIRIAVKLLSFNAAILAAYACLIFVFGLSALDAELQGIFGAILLLLGNVTFLLYDRMIDIARMLYRKKLRPRLFGADP